MNKVQRCLAAGAAGLMVMSIGVGLGGGPAQAFGPQLSGWDDAARVAVVNDPVAADGCPIESPDGKALFFASVRGPGGDNDIWMATRPDLGANFGEPTMLPAPINTDSQEFCPTPLDGGALLFVSTRVGTDAYGTAACGLGDIYLTHRDGSAQGWAEPRNLGCAPNGPNGVGMEYGPSLVHTPRGGFLYFSSGAAAVGAGTQDIYVSKMSSEMRFGSPSAVADLNTGFDDFMPNVSRDGREIVFASSRPGGQGASDIYTASAVGYSGKWRDPVNLGPSVNTAGGESRPSLSADGQRLYFGRNGDIFVSQRSSG